LLVFFHLFFWRKLLEKAGKAAFSGLIFLPDQSKINFIFHPHIFHHSLNDGAAGRQTSRYKDNKEF
jgi:hypothetical protein